MSDNPRPFQRIKEQIITPSEAATKHDNNKWSSVSLSHEVIDRLSVLKEHPSQSFDSVLRVQLDLESTGYRRSSKYGFDRLIGNYYTVLRIPAKPEERARIYNSAKTFASRRRLSFLVQFFEGYVEVRHLNTDNNK